MRLLGLTASTRGLGGVNHGLGGGRGVCQLRGCWGRHGRCDGDGHARGRFRHQERIPASAAPTRTARFNVFRDDVVKPSLTREEALAAAPATEDNRFRVPRILDEE